MAQQSFFLYTIYPIRGQHFDLIEQTLKADNEIEFLSTSEFDNLLKEISLSTNMKQTLGVDNNTHSSENYFQLLEQPQSIQRKCYAKENRFSLEN